MGWIDPDCLTIICPDLRPIPALLRGYSGTVLVNIPTLRRDVCPNGTIMTAKCVQSMGVSWSFPFRRTELP